MPTQGCFICYSAVNVQSVWSMCVSVISMRKSIFHHSTITCHRWLWMVTLFIVYIHSSSLTIHFHVCIDVLLSVLTPTSSLSAMNAIHRSSIPYSLSICLFMSHTSFFFSSIPLSSTIHTSSLSVFLSSAPFSFACTSSLFYHGIESIPEMRWLGTAHTAALFHWIEHC